MSEHNPPEKNIIITFSITFLIMVGVLVSALVLYPNESDRTNIGGLAISEDICYQDIDCNDDNMCTYDQCIDGICSYRNKVCNDGNPITLNTCTKNEGCIFI